MGKKLLVSEQQVIGIREFMEVYLGVRYDGNGKLTHYEMEKYMMLKGKEMPSRVSNMCVSPEKIMNGTYVVVREESSKKKKGKKIVYENPLVNSFGKILSELQAAKDYEQLKQIRRDILQEKHLFEDEFGELVDMDDEEYEINVRVNRQKTFVSISKRHMVKKGW